MGTHSVQFAQNVKLPLPGRIRTCSLRTANCPRSSPEWLGSAHRGLLAVTECGEVLPESGGRLDIDRTGRRILLPQTKNGDGRIVYRNQLAW